MTVMYTRTTIGLALLLVLAATVTLPANTVVERFTFARPPAPESTVDPGSRLPLTIDRWSTDSERDTVMRLVAEDPRHVLDGLRDVGRIGTLYWPGGLEYTVRYARRQARADGGTDIVLLVDRPLWVWWDSNAASSTYPYSVVQIRVGRDGAGEGHVSLAATIAPDKALGMALTNYDKSKALITDLRRDNRNS
jgi:hypothetical protein